MSHRPDSFFHLIIDEIHTFLFLFRKLSQEFLRLQLYVELVLQHV